jgi:hypothetical protein
MSVFKCAAAVALIAPMAMTSVAHAGALTKFASTTEEDFTYTSATSTFNVTGGGSVPEFLQTSAALVGLAGYSANVLEAINGGSGVTVTSATDNGTTTNLTLGAFTLSYDFSTPTKIGNVYVTNLLTLTVGAGALVTVNDDPGNQFATLALNGSSLIFTSDILNFTHVVAESLSFSFSSVGDVNGVNGLGGFEINGDGNFSSNPLPTVPEPASLALLVVGMTAVGVASRRRRAV